MLTDHPVSKTKVLLVAGARPNFMKVAPIWFELEGSSHIEPILVHTGQHYDAGMSDVFFQDLGLPTPEISLGVGSGSHAQQTAGVMVPFEKVCLDQQPSVVVVVGDVNSTIACALTAKKLMIPVAHIEAGLRSRDMSMPEEINRILTDAISDYCFTPSRDADENLIAEGIGTKRIHFVGNVMIDSLLAVLPRAEEQRAYERFELEPQGYGLVTIHRPSNVDDLQQLEQILAALGEIDYPMLFPVHPRTRSRLGGLKEFSGALQRGSVQVVDPLGYVEFLSLTQQASFVVTDSGGIQEETTYLGVPCLTLRKQTERPITLTQGTNQLATLKSLRGLLQEIIGGRGKIGSVPEYWDGKTAPRIVERLSDDFV